MSDRICIIGAGLSGLFSALIIAESGGFVDLVSMMDSERAQSVLAEGGINAVLDTMGENDTVWEHIADTLSGGVFLGDESAVRGMCEHAPELVLRLFSLGVPFHNEKGKIIQRNFGGQKKKRTAFAMSSTGKVIMTALTDEVRKWEQKGNITRFPSHELTDIFIRDGVCHGVSIKNIFTGETRCFSERVIIACGGMSGLFLGLATGSVKNTGDAQALLFEKGVKFSNLEMLQYHPTTISIPGKRLLVTEAARGEGGRLFTYKKDGSKWYFMEEKYPELKNLMPRDIVSREMYHAMLDENCQGKIYLDMTGISREVWKNRLSDLREELVRFAGQDPAAEYIEVSPGIHYFMGGIDVDNYHRTNIANLYASGECANIYHGANRLGGNSLLGAVYGGYVAAESAIHDDEVICDRDFKEADEEKNTDRSFDHVLADILKEGMAIARSGDSIRSAVERLNALSDSELSVTEKRRVMLSRAFLLSALERDESRGAHFRTDYPCRSDSRYKTVCLFDAASGNISVGRENI